jgi:hypothetical protein
MTDTFQRDGVRFAYPPDWQLETETEGDDGWTASLQGPGTAFLVVSYCPGIDDPSEVVDAAVEGLRADYPDLDAEDAVETIAGQPALGADVNFSHLDLTNTCWIRALPAADGSLLIMAQCTDDELDDQGAMLKSIMATLAVEE